MIVLLSCAGFVACAAAASQLTQPNDNGPDNKSPTANQNDGANQKMGGAQQQVQTDKDPNTADTEEDAQRKRSRFGMSNFELGSLVVGGLGVIGAFVLLGLNLSQFKQSKDAALQARDAAQTAKDTLAEMKRQVAIAERPWIKVAVTPGALRFSSNPPNISIDFKFTMTNVGKSVALDVAPDGELFLLRISNPNELDEGIRRQKMFCDGRPEMAARPENPFPFKVDGYVFPGEAREHTVSASTKPGELEQHSMRYSDQPSLVTYEAYFAGCVRYRFSFQGEWHHTYVNYKIVHGGKAEGGGLANIQFRAGQSYPADEILLFPSFQGGNYVD